MEALNEKITDLIQNSPTNGDIKKIVDKLQAVLKTAASEANGLVTQKIRQTPKHTKPWFDNECHKSEKKYLKLRRHMKGQWNHEIITKTANEYKSLIKKKKRVYNAALNEKNTKFENIRPESLLETTQKTKKTR